MRTVFLVVLALLSTSCDSQSRGATDHDRARQVSADSAHAVELAIRKYVELTPDFEPHVRRVRREGDEYVVTIGGGVHTVGGGATIRVTPDGGTRVEELTQ